MPKVGLRDILVPGALALLVALPARAAELRGPEAFAEIADERERSLAVFEEAAKVLTHPRCMNCHPAGDTPLQGAEMQPHVPPVFRGPANFGVAGMHCNTCHQQANYEPSGVPGHPLWHLAPVEMAWVGKSNGEICAQIKDPARNGDKDLEELHHHMAEDSLVGWGWQPGGGREPAPGDQETFGRLIRAWIDTGAACPAG